MPHMPCQESNRNIIVNITILSFRCTNKLTMAKSEHLLGYFRLCFWWFTGYNVIWWVSTGNKSWFLLFSLTKNMSSNELFCSRSISTTFIVFIYQPVGRPSPRNVSLNLWKPSISYPLINSDAIRNYHLGNQRSKWPCSTAMLVYQIARKSNLRLIIFQAWCHMGLVYMLIPC